MTASRWTGAGIGLALTAAILAAGLGFGGTPEEPTAGPPVLTVPVRPVAVADEYAVGRLFLGEVRARRKSRLGFELAGLVTRVYKDDGDAVKAGEPVAELDTRLLDAERRSAAASLAAAEARLQELVNGPRAEVIAAARAGVSRREADLKQARLDENRRRNLVNTGSISRERFEAADFGEDAAAAQLAAARARLAELLNGTRKEQVAAQRATVGRLRADLTHIDVRLEKSVLRAPFAGRVGVRLIDPGTVIGAGAAVIELVESGRLEVAVGVPAGVADRLHPSEYCTLSVRGRAVRGRVRALTPEVKRDSRTVSVVIDVDAGGVRPGDLARLRVAVPVKQPGAWVPLSALGEGTRGLWRCYVAVTSGGHYEVAPREVEVLHQEAGRAFVRGSLAAGERLIVAGTHKLVPGQLVAVKQ